MSESWTPERLELFGKLQPEGVSYGEIAVELNKLEGPKLTRNAVCGKAHRLGYSVTLAQKAINQRRYHPSKREPMAPKPPKPPRIKANGRGPEAYNLTRRLAHLAKPEKRPQPPAIDYTHAKPWIERKFGECAFPIGSGEDLLSCCAPTEDGQSYCRACRAVVYQDQTQAQRRARARIVRLAA